MPHTYDVAIIGAGPNGLTAAAYLAKAGARVTVLEKRFERGGTFATDDYSTPFLYNQAQLFLPLGYDLPPYTELELGQHSVTFIEPENALEVVGEAGELGFVVGRDGGGLGEDIEAMFAAVSSAVRPWLYQPPRPEAELLVRLSKEKGSVGVRLANLTVGELAALADSALAQLALRYVCALNGFFKPNQRLGLIGAYAIARAFSPTLVAGGSKSLANALFRVATAHGAVCHVSSGVKVITRQGDGFRLDCLNGRVVTTRVVISTLDPRTTFNELLTGDLGNAQLSAAGRAWKVDEVGTFVAHFGIKGPAPATANAENGEAAIRIVGFRGVDDLDRHLDTVRSGKLPARPAGYVAVTSAHDPLQASSGPYGPLHTLRFETFAPYEHPEGSWDRLRPAYRRACWDQLVDSLHGLSNVTLLQQFADAPCDFARRFGTTRGGTVRQGTLVPEQTLDQRPHPNCSTTRTPIRGFYLGGGSVHPGVSGSLGGGYLVAKAVCEDLSLHRWW